MWKGKRPSLGHIKIWGYEVSVRREAQDKLEARSEKSQRGVFLEREMISKEDSGSKINLEEIQESTDKEPIFYYGFHIELDKPANYKKVMASPKAVKWNEAMKSEIQSMYDTQVWNLVDTTPCLKTVGCKWIFKKKTDMDGKIHTYKARLLVAGIYAPMRKLHSFGFSRSEDESCIYVKVSGSVVVFLHGIMISKDLCPKTNEELDLEMDINKKDKNEAKTDKTEHGMERA
ncbi:hypothetical protein Tco_1128543 [Tanacetum coccineum]